MSPENEIVGTRRRKQCKSLQVAIGCFREKVYYTLSESRALSSPIGNRYSGRSRDLSHLRQVVPYRRSLFRRSAMNCLSPYAHFAPYGCRLRQLSRSCYQCSLGDVNFAAKPRSQAPALQVAIGCFREKVYYTLSESRALSSPIGASSRPRPSRVFTNRSRYCIIVSR